MAKKPIYIRLRNGRTMQTKKLVDGVMIDFNDKLQVIGIEFIDYKDLLLDGKKGKKI